MDLISVIFSNKNTGLVLPSTLDKLLESKAIIAFRRSDCWVFPEEDLIRSNVNKKDYKGLERRRQLVF